MLFVILCSLDFRLSLWLLILLSPTFGLSLCILVPSGLLRILSGLVGLRLSLVFSLVCCPVLLSLLHGVFVPSPVRKGLPGRRSAWPSAPIWTRVVTLLLAGLRDYSLQSFRLIDGCVPGYLPSELHPVPDSWVLVFLDVGDPGFERVQVPEVPEFCNFLPSGDTPAI